MESINEEFEFLDLTGADDHEKDFIQGALFVSVPHVRYPQLPWSVRSDGQVTPAEWRERAFDVPPEEDERNEQESIQASVTSPAHNLLSPPQVRSPVAPVQHVYQNTPLPVISTVYQMMGPPHPSMPSIYAGSMSPNINFNRGYVGNTVSEYTAQYQSNDGIADTTARNIGGNRDHNSRRGTRPGRTATKRENQFTRVTGPDSVQTVSLTESPSAVTANMGPGFQHHVLNFPMNPQAHPYTPYAFAATAGPAPSHVGHPSAQHATGLPIYIQPNTAVMYSAPVYGAYPSPTAAASGPHVFTAAPALGRPQSAAVDNSVLGNYGVHSRELDGNSIPVVNAGSALPPANSSDAIPVISARRVSMNNDNVVTPVLSNGPVTTVNNIHFENELNPVDNESNNLRPTDVFVNNNNNSSISDSKSPDLSMNQDSVKSETNLEDTDKEVNDHSVNVVPPDETNITDNVKEDDSNFVSEADECVNNLDTDFSTELSSSHVDLTKVEPVVTEDPPLPSVEKQSLPPSGQTTVDFQSNSTSKSAQKSWASLFKTGTSNTSISSVNKNFSSLEPFPSLPPSSYGNVPGNVISNSSGDFIGSTMLPGSSRSGELQLHNLAEFLLSYQLEHKAVSLQPRGLTNRGNWCYINSTLQALVACPPFYNLMKALPIKSRNSLNSTTPVIDSMIRFINEFEPLSTAARLGRREKAQQRKDDGTIDLHTGAAFEPVYIYKMLNSIRSDTFKVEGRQEDAEEFLSCLLNALNDEMLEVIKLVDDTPKKSVLSNGDITTNGDTASQSQDEDDTEWKVMGPKNKGSITRRTDFGRTPISDIFMGQRRSRVQRAGDDSTDSVQPFFTLQLDIEKAQSVKDALEILVGKDQLEGVTCSKTNQEIEAWQQTTLDELPLVLLLHLKWFDYKLDGCSKIVKTVEFPIDLKLDGKIMSSNKKYLVKQKQYKLFAVVYHDGKEATKGHYVTDVFHVGYGSWVRYDDSVVRTVPENNVLHPRQPRVPYLLYYRRCDTIGITQAESKTR